MDFPRLPIEKFDEDGKFQAFYVNRFSTHLSRYHSDITKPHKHDFYLTIYFTQGKGTHQIDFNEYDIKPGAVFFLQPEQVHNWTFEEDPEGWIFFHSADFYRLYPHHLELKQWSFFQLGESNHKINLEEKKAHLLPQYFEEIYTEYQQIRLHSFQKIAALVQLIYMELDRKFVSSKLVSESKNRLYEAHFSRFEALLEIHFKQEKSPAFYASELGMTVKHLHRVCTNNTGKGTGILIAERVVLEAKRLLVEEKLSLLQISELLGFENYPHFHLYFKKTSSETPKNFRLRS